MDDRNEYDAVGRSGHAGCEHAENEGMTAGDGSAAAESAVVQEIEDVEFLYELADLFSIFADTTRIKMLYALKGRHMSVSELAESVGVSQSAASHQLRTLKQARLVKFRKDGKNVYYSLCDDHVTTILEMGIDHLCE